MANTYTWVVKHLNTNMRGYADTGFFEMQGTDPNGKTATGSVSVSFGGADLKPTSSWTQADIDTYAATYQDLSLIHI